MTMATATMMIIRVFLLNSSDSFSNCVSFLFLRPGRPERVVQSVLSLPCRGFFISASEDWRPESRRFHAETMAGRRRRIRPRTARVAVQDVLYRLSGRISIRVAVKRGERLSADQSGQFGVSASAPVVAQPPYSRRFATDSRVLLHAPVRAPVRVRRRTDQRSAVQRKVSIHAPVRVRRSKRVHNSGERRFQPRTREGATNPPNDGIPTIAEIRRKGA